MYVIQTDQDHRIVAYDNSENPIVNNPERDFLFAELPDGITEENVFDFKYVNGEWIYDPRPPEPELVRTIVVNGGVVIRMPS